MQKSTRNKPPEVVAQSELLEKSGAGGLGSWAPCQKYRAVSFAPSHSPSLYLCLCVRVCVCVCVGLRARHALTRHGQLTNQPVSHPFSHQSERRATSDQLPAYQTECITRTPSRHQAHSSLRCRSPGPLLEAAFRSCSKPIRISNSITAPEASCRTAGGTTPNHLQARLHLSQKSPGPSSAPSM